MPLAKEETLQQEYFVLEKQDNELQDRIFELKRKKQNLKHKIESLTEGIKFLKKQKREKSWKITCLNIITFGIFKYYRNKKINNQIRIKQTKSEALRKKITENTKIKYSLKNKKLKVATELINILKSLWNNNKEQVIDVQTKIQEEISRKLDAILEQQRFNTIVNAKSSSSLEQDSSGYNSDDEQQASINFKLVSRQNSEDDVLEESSVVTCEKLNFDDDSDIEVLSCSSSLDSLSINYLDENLVNSSLDENNSNDEQCSNSSSQISSRQNIKDSSFGFKSELSIIMEEDDDGIEVISESEENEDGIEVISESEENDNIPTIIIKKHNFLLRHDSKDSGIDNESEQLIFDQSLINGIDDILEKYYSVANYPVK